MKKLIVMAIVMFAVSAHAGKVKLTWLQSSNDIAGNPVQLTKFVVHWGFNSGVLVNTIELGPPAPQPWRMDTPNVGRYSKTLESDAWNAGQAVCFAITAHTDTLSSGLSNIVCKTLSGNPMVPDVINLEEIP